MERVFCVLIGYLFGSFLTADIVAKVGAKTNAFEVGDGNPGMANIGHELGTKAAVACLAGDILKTVAAVLASHAIFPQLGSLATGWAGLGATLGHVFPFWHHFKGGKGVTTMSSASILMNPLFGIISGIVGIVAIVISGYLSVAAVIQMIVFAIAMAFVGGREFFIISCIFVVLTLYCHRKSLAGIKNGTTRQASLSVKLRNHFKRS